MSSAYRTTIIVTHLNVTLYALCFWIQIGTLPYLTKKFGVDPITFGYIQTTFATVQLMGGPIFGRLGDLFGSKYALMLAYGAAFLSYFLLGSATTVFMIFVSRLPSVCMHAMHGAQMVITDLSDPGTRSAELGKLGLSYGVGMVIGPIVGGLCTKYASEQAAAFLAASGSLASLALVVLFIPRDTKKLAQAMRKASDSLYESEAQDIEMPKQRGLFNVVEIVRIGSKNPVARALLFVKTLSGIPVGILHSMFSVLALNHFHLTAEMNGYILSYIGVLSMISQGFIVGRITRMGFNDWAIVQWSIVALCISNALLVTIVNGVLTFCVALLPMVIAGAVFTTVMSGMLTKSVAPKDTGTMLGISMAVNSLIRSIAPTAGGVLLETFGFPAFGLIGVIFNAPLIVYVRRFMT